LRNKLAAQSDPADILLIDCPPSLGILTLNALSTVDEVLIPLQPHYLALHGLSRLLDTIQLVADRLNPRLRLFGVVLCMYDKSTRLAAEVTEDIESFFATARERAASGEETTAWSAGLVMKTRIRKNIRLAEAPSFGQSISDYAADSNGAADYAGLAAEVVAAVLPARQEPGTAVGRAA